MEYISTRGDNKKFSFSEVFLKGLADDGGLFIPLNIKKFDEIKMNSLKKLSYIDLATEIIYLYTGDFLSKKELNEIVKKSYSNFREKDVVKIVELNQLKILELFHGPTLAFKDIAMQLIGNMYEHLLKSNNKTINIVVATSGDTGAAAIDAIKGKSNLNIFVLHPNNRISPVQRKLMTTVEDKNVFNIAIEGNFDDPEVHELLSKHFIELRAASPEGSAHVLDIPGLKIPSIKFWSLWENNKLMGCGALKFLDEKHGEFKSIRIHNTFRNKGYGIHVIQHLIEEAQKLNIEKLSIETGSGNFFLPARKLFKKCGFVECKPFAHYNEDPNSVYLTKKIDTN